MGWGLILNVLFELFERIHFCCFKPPSLWWCVRAVLENEFNSPLFCTPHPQPSKYIQNMTTSYYLCHYHPVWTSLISPLECCKKSWFPSPMSLPIISSHSSESNSIKMSNHHSPAQTLPINQTKTKSFDPQIPLWPHLLLISLRSACSNYTSLWKEKAHI